MTFANLAGELANTEEPKSAMRISATLFVRD